MQYVAKGKLDWHWLEKDSFPLKVTVFVTYAQRPPMKQKGIVIDNEESKSRNLGVNLIFRNKISEREVCR